MARQERHRAHGSRARLPARVRHVREPRVDCDARLRLRPRAARSLRVGGNSRAARAGDREGTWRRPPRRSRRQHVRRSVLIALSLVIAITVAIPGLPSHAAVSAIDGYQRTLSPVVEALGVRCRFTPSCSRYARIVIERDGIMRGGWKTLRRIARCNPLTPAGTRDSP